jgi:hypothetical protein
MKITGIFNTLTDVKMVRYAFAGADMLFIVDAFKICRK